MRVAEHNEDHEPVSTGNSGGGGGSISPISAMASRPSILALASNKSTELSPLRLALSTSNPILSASLSRPPVILSSAGIDLSKRSSPVLVSSKSSSPVHMTDPKRSAPISAELYANLLVQLRRGCPADSAAAVVSSAPNANAAQKLTAAARKEKLKSQPCFQCPVCKKRFQRHIAMSAHFQNEHIGQASTTDVDKKVCRLCSFVAVDIIAVRHHLLVQHGIDLDNPSASLVEPEMSASSTTTTTMQVLPTTRATLTPTTTPDLKRRQSPELTVDVITSSSSSLSPERRSPVSIRLIPSPLKSETGEDDEVGSVSDEQEHAKDLSIKRQLMRQTPEINNNNNRKRTSPYSNNNNASPVKKVVKTNVKQNTNVETFSPPDETTTSAWRCPHCRITFPNQTLYFLHRGFHSDADPWRCNGCGLKCDNLYDFNTHLVSDPHR